MYHTFRPVDGGFVANERLVTTVLIVDYRIHDRDMIEDYRNGVRRMIEVWPCTEYTNEGGGMIWKIKYPPVTARPTMTGPQPNEDGTSPSTISSAELQDLIWELHEEIQVAKRSYSNNESFEKFPFAKYVYTRDGEQRGVGLDPWHVIFLTADQRKVFAIGGGDYRYA